MVLAFAKTTTMETQIELRGIFKLTRIVEIQIKPWESKSTSTQTNNLLASMLVKRKPIGSKKNKLAKIWTNSQIVEKSKAFSNNCTCLEGQGTGGYD